MGDDQADKKKKNRSRRQVRDDRGAGGRRSGKQGEGRRSEKNLKRPKKLKKKRKKTKSLKTLDTIRKIDLNRVSFLDDTSSTVSSSSSSSRCSTLCVRARNSRAALRGAAIESKPVRTGRRRSELMKRLGQIYRMVLEKREFIKEECFVCLELIGKKRRILTEAGFIHTPCHRCSACSHLLLPIAHRQILDSGEIICGLCVPPCSSCGWLEETNTIITDSTTLCDECFVCRRCRQALWGRAWWTDWASGFSYCMGCAKWRLSREQGFKGTDVMLQDVGGEDRGLDAILEDRETP